ncbi:MAG TPA: helix-turn-helix domain-containing protein [Geopsychrobacteraceae bacterium]
MDECQSPGEYLRRQRQIKGLSLQDVAARTKITLSCLQALENGQYERLPAETYLKGFLVSYAEALGVPASGVLELYRADRPAPTQTVAEPPKPALHGSASGSACAWKPMVAILLLLAAVVGCGLWWLAAADELSPADAADAAVLLDAAAEQTAELSGPTPLPATEPELPSGAETVVAQRGPASAAALAPDAAMTAEPLHEPPPAPVVPALDLPAVLSLQALEPVAVAVSVDDRPVRTYTLQAGSLLRWRIQTAVELRVDPPAAVQLRLDAVEVTPDASGRFALPTLED